MSELIVKAGSWNSINSAEVEAFLATISRALGFTQEQQVFLRKVHEDIHGNYQTDEFYSQSLSTLIRWMPPMILKEINKDCKGDHRKQVKIWYNDLISLSSAKESPFYNLLIPQLTQMVNQL